MRIKSSDPDLETIYNRILRGDIVFDVEQKYSNKWDEPKRQKLIDTILRGWHVPSIHLIVDQFTGRIEVLDGFQRLSAIKDFIDGWLRIDGEIEPRCWLEDYDGYKFSQLSDSLKQDILSFSINCLVISDYSSGEPGELVSRLNHRSSLTGTEKRSLSYGHVRSKIKSLVSTLEQRGVGKDFFGFSNSRMVYDDVLARVALAIEQGGVGCKITSEDLSAWYNSDLPMSSVTVGAMDELVNILYAVSVVGKVPKFNKATLVSWLLFLSRAYINDVHWLSAELICDFMGYFDFRAQHILETDDYFPDSSVSSMLLKTYLSRSRTKVDDASSLLIRDAAIWVVFLQYLKVVKVDYDLRFPNLKSMTKNLHKKLDHIDSLDEVSDVILKSGWGGLECL